MLLILMGIIGAYVPRALDAGWRRSLLVQEEREDVPGKPTKRHSKL